MDNVRLIKKGSRQRFLPFVHGVKDYRKVLNFKVDGGWIDKTPVCTAKQGNCENSCIGFPIKYINIFLLIFLQKAKLLNLIIQANEKYFYIFNFPKTYQSRLLIVGISYHGTESKRWRTFRF